MLNLTEILELTKDQKEIIEGFGILTKEHWNKRERSLRVPIRDRLMRMQDNRCVYCDCPTDDPEDVEHIAHKADYPQFVFTPENLAYCCKNCNQTYKGDKDVIDTLGDKYEDCTFKIVHPYRDNVDEYFDTSYKIITIIRSNLSPEKEEKARFTFNLLRWGTRSVQRRRTRFYSSNKFCINNGTDIDKLIDDALAAKPSIL